MAPSVQRITSVTVLSRANEPLWTRAWTPSILASVPDANEELATISEPGKERDETPLLGLCDPLVREAAICGALDVATARVAVASASGQAGAATTSNTGPSANVAATNGFASGGSSGLGHNTSADGSAASTPTGYTTPTGNNNNGNSGIASPMDSSRVPRLNGPANAISTLPADQYLGLLHVVSGGDLAVYGFHSNAYIKVFVTVQTVPSAAVKQALDVAAASIASSTSNTTNSGSKTLIPLRFPRSRHLWANETFLKSSVAENVVSKSLPQQGNTNSTFSIGPTVLSDSSLAILLARIYDSWTLLISGNPFYFDVCFPRPSLAIPVIQGAGQVSSTTATTTTTTSQKKPARNITNPVVFPSQSLASSSSSTVNPIRKSLMTIVSQQSATNGNANVGLTETAQPVSSTPLAPAGSTSVSVVEDVYARGIIPLGPTTNSNNPHNKKIITKNVNSPIFIDLAQATSEYVSRTQHEMNSVRGVGSGGIQTAAGPGQKLTSRSSLLYQSSSSSSSSRPYVDNKKSNSNPNSSSSYYYSTLAPGFARFDKIVDELVDSFEFDQTLAFPIPVSITLP